MRVTLCALIAPRNSGKKKACIAAGFSLSGSTTWTRTRDPMINSHLLYQLSYRGMRRMLLIKKDKSSTLRHFTVQAG